MDIVSTVAGKYEFVKSCSPGEFDIDRTTHFEDDIAVLMDEFILDGVASRMSISIVSFQAKGTKGMALEFVTPSRFATY